MSSTFYPRYALSDPLTAFNIFIGFIHSFIHSLILGVGWEICFIIYKTIEGKCEFVDLMLPKLETRTKC